MLLSGSSPPCSHTHTQAELAMAVAIRSLDDRVEAEYRKIVADPTHHTLPRCLLKVNVRKDTITDVGRENVASSYAAMGRLDLATEILNAELPDGAVLVAFQDEDLAYFVVLQPCPCGELQYAKPPFSLVLN
jgi:hypothetical protein